MKKSWEQIHQELSAPFSHEDVEWKIQTVSKDKSRGLAVAYVTARAIQNRLDAVVGAQNWKPVFRQWHTVTDRDGNPLPSQLCTIQIFDDDRHEWLEKTDGAENTDYEYLCWYVGTGTAGIAEASVAKCRTCLGSGDCGTGSRRQQWAGRTYGDQSRDLKENYYGGKLG